MIMQANNQYANILLLGANGRTGREVKKLLATQLPGSVTISDFEGDALDYDNVSRQVSACDAVISVIGHVKGSRPDVQTTAIKNVVRAMRQNKIKRLVSLTGTGVRQPKDTISLIDRVLNLGVMLLDPDRINDGINHAQFLQSQPDIDWTVVRVLKLTNSSSNQRWRLSENGPSKTFVSRKTVAKAILQTLQSSAYIHTMPIIAPAR